MKILDLSAGYRAVWFDKNHPLTTYIDSRPEVNPTLVADSRDLPTIVGRDFNLIVFDPPHTNCGPEGDMAKRYGHFTTAQILELVEKTQSEAWRVAAPGALMAMKWNDHTIRLERVLELMPLWEPLFGHTVKQTGGNKHRAGGTRTLWVMLRRL